MMLRYVHRLLSILRIYHGSPVPLLPVGLVCADRDIIGEPHSSLLGFPLVALFHATLLTFCPCLSLLYYACD